MVFNALLDVFSLASFVPLIILLVDPSVIASNQYISYVYNAFSFSSPSNFVIALSLCVLIFTLIKNTLSLWITRSKAAFTFTIGSFLSTRMLGHYLELSYLKFTQSDFSKELNRIANIPIAFANNIVMPLATLVSEGLVFIMLLFCIVIYDFRVFVFLSVILVPVAVVYFLKRKSLKQTSYELKEKYPLTLKYALQVVEGLIEIKVLGKESFFRDRFASISQSLSKTFVRDHTTQTGTSRLTEIIAAFIICSLIIYSVLLNKNYQQTMLLLGVYAGASFRIIPSLNRMLNALLQLRTHEFLFEELDVLRHGTPLAKEQTEAPAVYNSKIELKNISFSYPDGLRVLDNASLEINKGDKIALVGRSGSGKTTLLLILLRFLTDHGGKVLLDGNEIEGKDLRGWKEMFGYVSQSPYIIDGSIMENIALGIPASVIDRGKVKQLIHDLDLEEMISQVPEGLDTQVGERGIKLSGGQRQRLAIARALYADAEILLLDEITNQLDARTEQEIIKTLDKVAQQKKTIIMITHHHNLLRRFDRVLRLENGELIEENQPQPISH